MLVRALPIRTEPVYGPYDAGRSPGLLEAVAPDSPPAKAGLMVGDQIKKIDGSDIATRVELLDAVAKGKGAPLMLCRQNGGA